MHETMVAYRCDPPNILYAVAAGIQTFLRFKRILSRL